MMPSSALKYWCVLAFFTTANMPAFAMVDDIVFPSSGAASIVPVWPEGKMPGAGAAESEKEVTPVRATFHITNVSHPTLLVFPAPGTTKATPAVVICPGGGYGALAIDLEGFKIAKWFNSIGITAAVLKYRVPKNKGGALQDLERAVRLVRANEKAWNIDDTRIGVMGFSAGGNLCARLMAGADPTGNYPPIDPTDGLSSSPNFVALIYPAYMGQNGQVSPDVAVHNAIPPLFIRQADDDKAYIPDTKIYDAALTAAKVPHEFADYPTGGHGFGLGRGAAVAWPDRFHAWLIRVQILPAAS